MLRAMRASTSSVQGPCRVTAQHPWHWQSQCSEDECLVPLLSCVVVPLFPKVSSSLHSSAPLTVAMVLPRHSTAAAGFCRLLVNAPTSLLLKVVASGFLGIFVARPLLSSLTALQLCGLLPGGQKPRQCQVGSTSFTLAPFAEVRRF